MFEAHRRGAQADVYATAALPAVDAFLNGYSACLVVYGQTGSGKSHTMFGGAGALDAVAQQYATGAGAAAHNSSGEAPVGVEVRRDVGLVPRVVVDVLRVVARMRHAVDATVTVNYVEIYNDKVGGRTD